MFWDFVLCEWVALGVGWEKKPHRISKKGLTCEMKIDNLDKFAKTSLAVEVILDGPKQGLQEEWREIEVNSKYRRQQRIKFEDTNLAYADFVLDPKLPA
jgi:hypothetical protein